MKSSDSGGCGSGILLFGLLGGFVYMLYYLVSRAVEFVTSPDAWTQTVQTLEGCGLCIGVAILFVVLGVGYSSISDRISRARFHRIVKESAEIPVLCTPIVMQKWLHGELPLNLAEEPGQDAAQQILCHLTLTNHGLALTTPPGSATQMSAAFPLDLFDRDWSDAAFFSLGTARLFYLPYRPGHAAEPVALGDGALAYHDDLPSIPDGYQLEIILLIQCILYRTNLDSAPWLEHPLKLKIRVLDANGQDDLRAALRFYGALHTSIAAAQAPDDDDSWMYHSRPIYW